MLAPHRAMPTTKKQDQVKRHSMGLNLIRFLATCLKSLGDRAMPQKPGGVEGALGGIEHQTSSKWNMSEVPWQSAAGRHQGPGSSPGDGRAGGASAGPDARRPLSWGRVLRAASDVADGAVQAAQLPGTAESTSIFPW